MQTPSGTRDGSARNCALRNIRGGKDKTRPRLDIGEIFEYDIETPKERLARFCSHADFVFNLAGVNRPKDNAEFMAGNYGFASDLLDKLKKQISENLIKKTRL